MTDYGMKCAWLFLKNDTGQDVTPFNAGQFEQQDDGSLADPGTKKRKAEVQAWLDSFMPPMPKQQPQEQPQQQPQEQPQEQPQQQPSMPYLPNETPGQWRQRRVQQATDFRKPRGDDA